MKGNGHICSDQCDSSLCVGQSLQPTVCYKPFPGNCQVLVLLQISLIFFLQLGYLHHFYMISVELTRLFKTVEGGLELEASKYKCSIKSREK